MGKYLLIILSLSLATHFAFFGHPAETVFDEVHFGKFVSGYFTGEYFFDIHPPLGKLMIAGMAKIAGFEPGFSFETIGQKFTDDAYKWLRFLPKLAGALLPLVIFLIALELGLSQKFSFLAGLLTIFENSLIVQSRFILIDSFLLLFGFLGILFYLKSRNSNSTFYLLFSTFFAALATSIKWTGLSFLAIILIFYFFETFKYKPRGLRLKPLTRGFVLLLVIPFLIYFSIFAIHFSLLPNQGPGSAFHPADFQNFNLFEKFIELNAEIYQSNARLSASHPYSSQWFTWPLMLRPVFYWQEKFDTTHSRIYLLGNPLIYWLATAAVIYFLISIGNFKNHSHFLLLTSYFLNWLPFIFIGRVMFLYHYFPALIFAILMLAKLLDKAEFKHKKIAYNAILFSSIFLFLFFSPLTYGLEIPEWYYKLMVWLPSWK